MRKELAMLKAKTMAVGMGAYAAITSFIANPLSVFAAQSTTTTTTTTTSTAPASSSVDLSNVTSPIIGLINSVLNVAIPLVAAVGTLYCVLLGVKFAQAEEPQDREKAKTHLKNAIIGFVLIFVLIVALRIATPILTDWMNANS